MLKAGGQIIIDKVHRLVNEIWDKETIPTEWQEALIVPIHKKGDKQELCEDGVWRIRHNRELRELFKDPDIIGEVKSRRLRWVGHILRRKEESLLKIALRGNPRGRRPIGRPKARWWGQVRKDLERMRLVEEDAWDRDYWRQRVGEAKYQLGYKWPWQ
ncbi:uncharacterized protein LOC129002085 [Macrosteles quadrilineatus]|uniref:uncharacterized protein LOC129002085 n=1 Tax=Macrosteles quadrilineatus TaxID=74068 RepID=UPI0023E27733|nr:uncharacterized protein LOC129002085 [Macrosteles quadrilineatus]